MRAAGDHQMFSLVAAHEKQHTQIDNRVTCAWSYLVSTTNVLGSCVHVLVHVHVLVFIIHVSKVW